MVERYKLNISLLDRSNSHNYTLQLDGIVQMSM